MTDESEFVQKGIPTNSAGPSMEQRVHRLEAALAALATEVSLDYDELSKNIVRALAGQNFELLENTPRPSAEEIVERLLFHFDTSGNRV